jgi:single-strand DNA-binding protein
MIGNLTRDIELKYLPSGSAIANGAIATSHKYKMQDGTQREEVCFLDFSVFGKQGEVLNQYVRKGSKVMLEGRLILEQWQDQATGAKRSRHTLRVDNFKFLDSKADSMGGSQQGGGYNAPQQQQPAYNQTPQQQQYNQPQQQNNYNAQPNTQYGQAQQQGGMQQEQSRAENIPTIDIDNDEIPF